MKKVLQILLLVTLTISCSESEPDKCLCEIEWNVLTSTDTWSQWYTDSNETDCSLDGERLESSGGYIYGYRVYRCE